MSKKTVAKNVEKSEPQSKPWGKMTKEEFLKAATDAIVAGRHPNPPTTYITGGRLVTPTSQQKKRQAVKNTMRGMEGQ